MTEEEMKGTLAYHTGQSVVANTWKEDKDKLRPENNPNIKDTNVYSKTFDMCQAIWKTYRNNIPNMDTKEFWKYPMGDVASTSQATNSDDSIDWLFNAEDSIDEGSPCFSTIAKLLIRFSRAYDYLWQKEYCEKITGHQWNGSNYMKVTDSTL